MRRVYGETSRLIHSQTTGACGMDRALTPSPPLFSKKKLYFLFSISYINYREQSEKTQKYHDSVAFCIRTRFPYKNATES